MNIPPLSAAKMAADASGNVDSSGNFMKQYFSIINKAQSDKTTYTEKLEDATGDDIFKYLLLINTSALEGYIAQTRIQAEQSFRISKIVAGVGFVLIIVGIIMGFFSNISAAYIAAISGILTEFISGVFFYLYNKTLQQLNLFHNKMLSSQHASMSFMANRLISDVAMRDQCIADLSKVLLSTTFNEE